MRTRRLVLLAITTLTLCSVAFAEEWNKTYTVTAKPTLKVETSDAAINVSASDRSTIEARVTVEGYKIGPDGIRIIEHQTGNVVEIEVRYPQHDIHFGWHSSHVEINVKVPREAIVGLRTGDGRITVSGVKGDIDTWSGDGAQEIAGVDGALKAHTGDGRIVASGRFDALDLTTGDGRIEATAQANSTVSRDWNLRTGDGSVSLRLPEKLAADVELHTSDGHINVDLPITVSGKIGGNNVRGKLNGGGRLLSVHTGDGSITVERS
ncbi:MAG TPA: DUF4097 family beta strand repeat-containing protein [Terriglobales bacterium]|nr:DUF4097 family beta strand repeat-containing protein [Terriglobales bacterium]